mmetsp:Transcript_47664/g.79242  ORF Transcript_47664/g.79242 Transcript_47664/m.79242 type:complete len:314 (-) Transcript_47664:191-1132(-)
MANRTKWGDDDDFSDEEFPVREETPIDENGFKYITEYKKNARGEKVKVTTKVKMVTEITRTNKQVFERKKWTKFGAPAAEDADESNVTIATNEDIRIESPEESEKAKPQVGASEAMAKFWEKQRRRQLERQMGLDTVDEADKPPAEDDEPGGGSSLAKIVASGGPGKYVPPSMRGGAGARANRGAASMDSGEREFPTLRVTNISEDTGEDDLKELFNPFGRVHRIYLAKNRETMQSRGFAFVSFYNKADAQRAMDELQGYGYDHLILKIEWAKPSTRNVQETGLGGAHMSGYGKKLAQDTTEKVSYASNLTGP